MAIELVDLPVEIQSHIIRLLFFSLQEPWIGPGSSLSASFRHPSRNESSMDLFPYRVWQVYDRRSTRVFPFNVAFTCDLWRDIVAEVADYWPRLIFDISKPKETRTLLIAFDAMKEKLAEGQVDVLIYSSRALEKAEENIKVQIITDALKHYVPRYKSVIFDLTYASSLPPSHLFFLQDAPGLEALELGCRVNDMEAIDVARRMVERVELRDIQLANSFSRLKQLTLSGPTFMDILPTSEWLAGLNLHVFIIEHFEFTKEGPYSLLNFAEHISKLSVRSLHLRHLSLAYEYDGHSYLLPAGYRPPHITSQLVWFVSVSEAFMENMYAISDITAADSIEIEDCSIPANFRCDGGQFLRLERIHDAAGGLSPSLCHILKAWGGRDVTFDRCPGVNDELLAWMGKQVDYIIPDDVFYPENAVDVVESDRSLHAGERFLYSKATRKGLPAWDTSSLYFRHCDNFSSAALRGMLQSRKDIVLRSIQRLEEGQADQPAANPDLVQEDDDQTMVTDLHVYGKVRLAEEDKAWFLAEGGNLNVDWSVINGVHSFACDTFTVRQSEW
ncbi:hypothetical protein CVT26_012548 [Gymnopilus dilepis]|uniref:F-box domain-containing protein n=1 Tax=Gymnopilus dilepis TaxID=231916 RepID=A0A409WAJ0_9AGAR|nr:hypothetical protein CVT26_012548 [Gymnopilus dilepis]